MAVCEPLLLAQRDKKAMLASLTLGAFAYSPKACDTSRRRDKERLGDCRRGMQAQMVTANGCGTTQLKACYECCANVSEPHNSTTAGEHGRFQIDDPCTSHPATAHELFSVSAGDACSTGRASLVYTLARRRNFGDMLSPIITRFVAGAPALPVGLDLFQLHKDSGNTKSRAQHLVDAFKRTITNTSQPRPALFALGSILHHAQALAEGFSQAERRAFTVWGSGLKDGDGKGHYGEPPMSICDPNKTASAARYFSQVARVGTASHKARGSYLPLPASTWAADLDVRATRGPLTLRLLRTAGARVPRNGVPYGDPALLLPWVFPKCFRI